MLNLIMDGHKQNIIHENYRLLNHIKHQHNSKLLRLWPPLEIFGSLIAMLLLKKLINISSYLYQGSSL